ncbi:MAG: ABC-2 transporter permease [Oscillospiraceae bacterium]|nr:ABC-2 transporter permease [Oscillospiraceae bacterium]
MKFRSLMYREFRLSRKFIILQFGLLLAWMALAWGMMLSMDSVDFTDEALPGTADVIIMMSAMVGSMSLLLYEEFKADINSGWLNYSYALPITPAERTAARFICRLSVSFVSALISLCNAAAICAHVGKPFGANYIVWHIVVLASVILGSLPNDFFILRARSGADMKKMQTISGMAMMGLMIAVIAVIFIASGIDLKKLAEEDTLFELPVFTAGALAWAVPLLLAVMAASFFASYFSLRSAYAGAVRPEKKKENAEIKPQVVSEIRSDIKPDIKTDGTTGLLYKELKQNRLMLILAACTPILLTVFPFCFSAIDVLANNAGVNELFETATSMIIRVLMCVCGIFIVSGLMSEVFRGDDKKLWAYFVVSTPQGVKGFLYRKYVVTVMMNLVYMASGIFADNLLATVNYFATGNELTTSMSSLYILGVFFLMSVSALDIPFMVRYGSKKGSMVKMIIMLSISTAAIMTYSLMPEAIQDKVTQVMIALYNGEANDALMLITSLLPYIIFAAFLFSYKISCGVFMKGVNEYDK